ncbi:zinc finger protein 271-like [Physella acuta]|uniref:zinc finger protein 271-like n=1 Tax=Physella acuta TaxID=109671 RepID=UPI0027DBB677|nr:zinc finger protein 271-like [Physella acuta]XP_059155480.1 zinc finger protein 271-like [Physella acuta]
MDSYAAVIDNQMSGASNSLADFQVPSTFPQFPGNSSLDNSYGNLQGLSSPFSNTSTTQGSSMNVTGYNTQQPSYNNMSVTAASPFAMPYDPPPIQPNPSPMHVSTPQASPLLQTKSNKAVHSCTYCGLVLSSANALLEHKRIHTGDRPFSCHICNKSFTQKAHLNIHKRTHTGEKPYACHVCHKRFAQSSHLSSHKRIHTGEKPFVCKICHIGFTQKQRLDAHHKKHLERPGQEIVVRQRTIVPSQVEQHRIPQNDDSSFMQMIGHGMPYIKQETPPDVANSTITSASSTEKRILTRSSVKVENGKKSCSKEENREEEDDKSSTNSDQSPKVTAPSFSSEGMFLHPSGYVAYGGIGDSEESSDLAAVSETCGLPHNGTSSSSHRRKSSVVRKRRNESPVKEHIPGIHTSVSNELKKYSILQADSITNHSHPDSDTLTSCFKETQKTLEHEKDPPYNGVATGQSDSNENPNKTENKAHCHINQNSSPSNVSPQAGLIKVNNRISLVNFTAEELVLHLMKRDDVNKCHFCCLIFQDPAMYHIHRNMHDKTDIHKCNMCGKMLQDKYDFTAHFLSMHQS